MSYSKRLIYLVLTFAIVAVSGAEDEHPFVTTSTGKIFGKRVEMSPHQLPDFRRTAAVYSRIPYAEPPVGDLRYRPPVPTTVQGDFDATRSGIACLQPESSGAFNLLGDVERSEDCLYLDVFVPEPQKTNTPVMVSIHGGGYFTGLGSPPGLSPIPLALVGDVIIVTLNYRLGPLGFLASGDDEIPANLGLLDQRQALLWVRENIAVFGGDPEQVTIFGVSAGGSSVNLHLLSPMSSGLFSGAIMQSGNLNNAFSHYSRMEDAVRSSHNFGQRMGCDVSDSKEMATCLRQKSSENFQQIIDTFTDTSSGDIFPLRPVTDGYFLPDDPFKLAATGSFNPAVVMNGCLSQEGNLMSAVPELLAGGDLTSAPSYNKTRFQDFISATLRTSDPVITDFTAFVYSDPSQLNDPQADYFDTVSGIVGDTMFLCPANTMTKQLAAAGRTVYPYLMTHVSSQPIWGEKLAWLGATHGSDVTYVTGSPLLMEEEEEEEEEKEEQAESESLGIQQRFNQEEVEMSLQIMRYWSNFAKSGDPNLSSKDDTHVTSETYPSWPKSTVTKPMYKELSLKFANHEGTPKTKQCFYWESLFPTLLQNSIEKARLAKILEERVDEDSQKSCTGDGPCP